MNNQYNQCGGPDAKIDVDGYNNRSSMGASLFKLPRTAWEDFLSCYKQLDNHH